MRNLLSNFAEHGFSGGVAKPYRLQELGDVLSRVIKGKETYK